MSHATQTGRRQFLTTVGLGGAALLSGCVSAPAAQTNDVDEPAESGPTTEAAAASLDPAKSVDANRVAADPTAVPDPIDRDEPREVEFTLTAEEVTAEVEPGVTFDYMTYDGQIPGPMLRVREGDRVRLRFEVPKDENELPHNVDSHAIYGPGGGAEATTLAPGDDAAVIEFTASYPGVHIYHCAVPNMDVHISSGMFGAMIVEPKEGLPEVDRELYFGQHELYTTGEVGEEGHHAFDREAMENEDPTYVVFNGEPYAFTADGYGPVTVQRDETVRVYFANGGPNKISSWHPIGNVWSRLYRDGDVLSDPARNVETTPVAPGTVTAAEMETPVPGPIKIVDHALSRAGRRGALGVVQVEGEENPDVYDEDA
ncbi:copper-containing nitrite reductase [Haloparvum sedimenti]|uniref:copper-containing nitrite reductase n=1 Tax=Haloparvum sedimenti TaxID=1678448 RepID=UPI00071E7B46|nr:copper-containing nitrite reductase [Haloparvum sedimenti]